VSESRKMPVFKGPPGEIGEKAPIVDSLAEKLPKKVVFCVPTITKPFRQTIDSFLASVPLIKAAGWDDGIVYEIGNPYISAARATLLRKALDAKATVVVFIDHDVSWSPGDLLKLIETEGDVVAGTYRFKQDAEIYMGMIRSNANGTPKTRESDGAIAADWTPAGFLKVTREAVSKFMLAYPELCFGEACNPSVDLFNHGAHERSWWGEDAAFGRRWVKSGGEIWVVPDLNITHHSNDKAYPGNLHKHLLRQPGGSEDPAISRR
jgi:glycosyltransferase involved in cell wall biosynthesis